tara:strand:+ start:2727 stop:3242 length:516 start_codon:yes stop_codon:yes gene_type:complete
MAGSLIKIQETTVSSSTASVTLTGIDSTYDVYMISVNNVVPITDSATPYFRVTKSGTAQSDAEYDYAVKQLRSDTSPSDNSETDINEWKTNDIGTNTGEVLNMILYLYNFNSSSEYSFMTQEISQISSDTLFRGRQGGGVHTVASASDGIQFLMSSGNIASGDFKLYGIKK